MGCWLTGYWTWLTSHYVIDWFSPLHVLAFAALAWALRVKRVGRALLVGLAIGLAWEVLEGQIEWLWAQWGEPPLNRWLSDPLMDLLGSWSGWLLRNRRRGST